MAKLKRKTIPYGKYMDDKYAEDRKYNARISGAIRMATNARVQGSSAIQTKVTMIEADKVCGTRDDWALWGSIHDELVFEIPADFTREDIEVIRNIMVESYTFEGVDNGTDIEIMTVWGEGVTVDEWFANKSAI